MNQTKKIVALFIFVFTFSFALFGFTKVVQCADSHINYWLIPLYDENSCTINYIVQESGEELEYQRIASITGQWGRIIGDSGRASLVDLTIHHENEDGIKSSLSMKNNGQVDLSVSFKDGVFHTSNFKELKTVGEDDNLPLTFPASRNQDGDANDKTRAYEVLNTLGNSFKDALSFINDGKRFNDYEYFSQMAYFLTTADNGAVITNGYGHQYKISLLGVSPDTSGYCRVLAIEPLSTRLVGDNDARSFVYAMKKGYNFGDSSNHLGESMEKGQRNAVFNNDSKDTVWLTWEHLLLEAQMLYTEGVSYSTVSNIYEGDMMKKTFNTFSELLTSNWLSALGNMSGDSMLSFIFNLGNYGTTDYVYGVYPQKANGFMSTTYMIFVVIALSLITVSIIRIANQQNSFSVSSRVNLLNETKSLILALLMISFFWLFFRLLLMGNYYFVNIWKDIFINTSSSNIICNSNPTAFLFSIGRLIVWLYLYFIYAIRRVFVPALFAIAPLFLWAFSLGEKYRQITAAWFKELLGNIYTQSLHAFVLCFVVYCMDGQTDFDAVIVWACLIPVTSLFRNITGIGGKDLVKAASNLTRTGATAVGAGLSMAGSVAGSGMGAGLGAGLGAIGDTADIASQGVTRFGDKGREIGNAIGNAVGDTIGGMSRAGTGLGLSMIGENGDKLISHGTTQVDHGLSTAARSVSSPTVNTARVNALSTNPPRASLEQGEDFVRSADRRLLNNDNLLSMGTIENTKDGGFTYVPGPSSPSSMVEHLGSVNQSSADHFLTQNIKNHPDASTINVSSRHTVGSVSGIDENINRMKDARGSRLTYDYSTMKNPLEVKACAVDSLNTYQDYRSRVQEGRLGNMSEREQKRIQHNYQETIKAFGMSSMSVSQQNGNYVISGVRPAAVPTANRDN